MTSKFSCGSCGVVGVKLWRDYGTFFHAEELRCVDCACTDQSKPDLVYDASKVTAQGKIPSPHPFMHGRYSDNIGWMVPLIVSEDEETVWGYTSCPEEDIVRWEALPNRKQSALESND